MDMKSEGTPDPLMLMARSKLRAPRWALHTRRCDQVRTRWQKATRSAQRLHETVRRLSTGVAFHARKRLFNMKCSAIKCDSEWENGIVIIQYFLAACESDIPCPSCNHARS